MLLSDGPEDSPLRLLLAHGAGAAMDSAFMDEFARGLAEQGVRVVRFEFPYMARARAGHKRGAPDRMPVLEQSFAQVLGTLGLARDWFIGGKSMGGRVATRIADSLGVRGVIALGYPFHPPKQPEQLRTAHLIDLGTPCLIVQGTRDPFGTREEVEPRGPAAAAFKLASSIELAWLGDGDHSFEPRKSSGRSYAQNLAEAIAAAATFMRSRQAEAPAR
jgi:predicted alpha/beta-hydrolase family hydrolase